MLESLMNKEQFNIFSERNELCNYAVKVLNQRNGSGVLFVPSGDNYAYIFTAAHVVKDYIVNYNLPIFITYYGKVEYTSEECESCLIYKKNEQGNYDEDILDDSDSLGTSEDVAVFRILKKCLPEKATECAEIDYVNENNIDKQYEFGGLGFPNNSDSRIEIYGTIDEWKEENKLFVCENEYTINNNQFVNFMKGYSGTGIFIEKDNRFALAGLIIACKSNEMHNRFSAIGMTDIVNEMRKLNWSTPKNEGNYNIPDTFLEKQCNCIEIIKNRYEDSIQTKLQQIFMKIIIKSTPKQLAINEKFYNIPICNKHRQDCPYYWAGKLLLLLYFECKENLFKDADMNLWKDDINIKYICSEGSGNADIGTVVESIVESKVLKNEFINKNIIVWQSMMKPQRRIFGKKQMNKRIETLIGENLGKAYMEGYYLMDGEINKRECCLVHINEFVDKLANIDDEDINIKNLKDVFEEVMENGWR